MIDATLVEKLTAHYNLTQEEQLIVDEYIKQNEIRLNRYSRLSLLPYPESLIEKAAVERIQDQLKRLLDKLSPNAKLVLIGYYTEPLRFK